MSAPVRTSFGWRDAIPYVTIRPNGASAFRHSSNTRPPAISKTTSTRRPPLASLRAAARSSRSPSSATSAPSDSASSRLSSVEASAITRPAPIGLPSCVASEPTPPAAATTTTVSPSATRPTVRYRCQAVSPCSSSASAVPSLTPSGIGTVIASGTATYSA